MRIFGRTVRWDLAVTLGAAALSLYALGGVMRETDQASLLDGALKLARGEASIFGAYSYNYDKQFVSYWLLAAVLKMASLGGMEFGFRNTVFVGNLFAWMMFWGGMISLVARRGTGRAGPAILIAGTLLSPMILLNSVILCPNVISAGFLAGLAGQIGGRKPIGRADAASAGVLTFLAVGARADAVLCLPFLCWLTTRRPGLRNLVKSRRNWAMFFGAIAALGTGYLISTGSKVYAHPPILIPSVIGAFVVFGFGGGFAMFLVVCGALGSRAMRAGSGRRKKFYLAGLVFALLPLGFYGFQLYTPRHFMTTAWLVLFFATAWRGEALMRAQANRRIETALLILFLVTGAGPLFFGLRLPAVNRPQITMAGATRYPTTDGHLPMGAVLEFMGKERRAATAPLDHNQALWSALATVDFESIEGVVPIYSTPLRPYFELAATLQGMRARTFTVDDFDRLPFLYGDERLLKRASKTAWEGKERIEGIVNALREFPKTVVSDRAIPQAILKMVPGGTFESNPEVEKRLALAKVFAGNEFDVLGEVTVSGEYRVDARGRTMVFFSDRPFEVEFAEESGEEGKLHLVAEPLEYTVPNGAVRRVHFVQIDGLLAVRPLRARISGDGVARVYAARTVLPGYMGVGKL